MRLTDSGWLEANRNRAVVEGLAMMTFNPSIGRVLARGSGLKFKRIAWRGLGTLSRLSDQSAFDQFHHRLVLRTRRMIRHTARGRRVSYGQAQKAVNVRLILLDARGHGRSEKPHEPSAYEPQLFVADILAVLDHLRIAKAHYWGYSMGGRIGFAAATHAPERFSSFTIGGAHPYQDNRDVLASWLPELQKGAGAIASHWETALSPALQARLLTNDMEALVAYWRQRIEDPGYQDGLSTLTMPCLLYAGEADGRFGKAQGCVTHIPNATFLSLPGLKHAEGFFRSDLVLPHAKQFLATVPS